MAYYYKLNEDMTTSETSLMDYAVAVQSTNSNKIAHTLLPHTFTVSTVFLRLDHSFNEDESELFETMVFNKAKTNNMREFDYNRYANYEDAIKGHAEMVSLWIKKIKEDGADNILKDHT